MCRLNPRVDFAFKKLFGSEENKDILISFINAVVSEDEQITDLVLKNPYNPKNFGSDKLSILDVKAVDQKGRWYNIEMQITDQEYYDKRALYYWSRIYNSQLQEGINYDKLTKTIGINVLNFNCIEEDDESEYHNVYKLLNVRSKKEFIDHVEIHFIELEKYNKDLTQVQTVLDRWTTFLKRAHEYNKNRIPTELSGVDSIKKAIEVLDTMYLDEHEREVYEARLKWLRDEEMAIKTAEKKGMEKGLQEALQKMINSGMSAETARNILGMK